MSDRARIIDSAEQTAGLVDSLVLRQSVTTPPILYIDLEGVKLSRAGSISIMTLMCNTGAAKDEIFIVDAFETIGVQSQKTLKDVLQDEETTKVFFDVRNDSDALFAHYGVALQGVEDVQLMESATRKTTASRRLVSGLSKCVEKHCRLPGWKRTKQTGERLFKAEHGGSYAVFNQRSIPTAIISYCAGDVECLSLLREQIWPRQTEQWKELIRGETKQRIAASQWRGFLSDGPDKAIAPWTNEQNRMLDQWHSTPDVTPDYQSRVDTVYQDWTPRSTPPGHIDACSVFDASDDKGSDSDFHDSDECNRSYNCPDVIDDEDYCLYYSD